MNLERGNLPLFFVCFFRNSGKLLSKWFCRNFWSGVATSLKKVRHGSVIIGISIPSHIFLTFSALSWILPIVLLSGWSHCPPLLCFSLFGVPTSLGYWGSNQKIYIYKLNWIKAMKNKKQTNIIRTSQTPYRWANGSYETCPVFDLGIVNEVPVAWLDW